jgi:hypothetical protein
MRYTHPHLDDEALIFVNDIRQGSIIADLMPGIASLVGHMDQIMIIEQFVRSYGGRLGKYFHIGGRAEDVTKSELEGFIGQVAAIANNKNGKGQIRAVSYENGERKIRASIEFNHETAVKAIKEIETHKRELERISSADHERVLMTFKRSDIGRSGIGVRSGERVIIEEISKRDFALIYGANLAEERIKDQMRNTDENIFHKGFVVDINVTTRNGNPVAYSVVHVHDIIDIGESA